MVCKRVSLLGEDDFDSSTVCSSFSSGLTAAVDSIGSTFGSVFGDTRFFTTGARLFAGGVLSRFMGDGLEETCALIRAAEWEFEEDDWQDVSPEAKDFITLCLTPAPRQRPSIEQCKAHTWIVGGLWGRVWKEGCGAVQSVPHLGDAKQRLRQLQMRRRLREGMHAVLFEQRILSRVHAHAAAADAAP